MTAQQQRSSRDAYGSLRHMAKTWALVSAGWTVLTGVEYLKRREDRKRLHERVHIVRRTQQRRLRVHALLEALANPPPPSSGAARDAASGTQELHLPGPHDSSRHAAPAPAQAQQGLVPAPGRKQHRRQPSSVDSAALGCLFTDMEDHLLPDVAQALLEALPNVPVELSLLIARFVPETFLQPATTVVFRRPSSWAKPIPSVLIPCLAGLSYVLPAEAWSRKPVVSADAVAAMGARLPGASALALKVGALMLAAVGSVLSARQEVRIEPLKNRVVFYRRLTILYFITVSLARTARIHEAELDWDCALESQTALADVERALGFPRCLTPLRRKSAVKAIRLTISPPAGGRQSIWQAASKAKPGLAFPLTPDCQAGLADASSVLEMALLQAKIGLDLYGSQRDLLYEAAPTLSVDVLTEPPLMTVVPTLFETGSWALFLLSGLAASAAYWLSGHVSYAGARGPSR